jgi:hypothetical protein
MGGGLFYSETNKAWMVPTCVLLVTHRLREREREREREMES